jgi:GNAT superfamily N-acetyltransferase
MELTHGSYTISDDPTKLDVEAMHAYLTRSYWSEGIPIETVRRAVRGSLCIGGYDADGKQVGLVRVISDCATFAYLCDVYVLEEHRKLGLAKAMLSFARQHPKLQGLRSWNLRTRDAHKLYAEVGFKAVDNPDTYMVLRFPEVYRSVLPGK